MKQFLLGGAALIALTNFAHASVVFSADVGDGLHLTLSDTLPTSTYAPFTFDAANFLYNKAGDQVLNGQIIAKSPFSDTTTKYDAVLGQGYATFGAILSEARLLTVGQTDFSGDFGSGSGTFSFVWGTPDTYNTLSFNTDTGFKSFNGLVLAGIANGGGSYFATVSGLGNYYSTTFESDSNAFEFAAVGVVPLPASAPMFGAALVALGILGYGAKRKAKAAA